ncbi:ChrR family anti-sigma-E factor [Benzoatithermus flavus]|uniref:ChrR family anti-sigma-E factor n=1 Tax=Benzoatithermus flavus TaxID=3108223 RepID=A0ABU8XY52_9PROT
MSGHPSVDELLMAHAAGRLPEPVALAVATHLALCPAARSRYAAYEALGGMFLETLPPATLAEDAWERLLSRLDTTGAGEPEEQPRRDDPATTYHRLPRPLRDYLPGPLETLRWRRYGGVAEAELTLRTPGYRTTLVRVRAGRAVPQHTHEGNELTVVLEGAFHDERGRYQRGDLVIADGSVDHMPVADESGDCLCLAVTDAPLRLTGMLGRFLNPFVRI